MTVIEIRAHKKKHTLGLVLLGLATPLTIILPYTSGVFNRQSGHTLTQCILIASAAFMGFAWYTSFKKLRMGEPVLTISRDGIEVNDKKNQFFAWSWIDNWKIEKDDSTNYLIIESGATRKKVMVDMLEIKANEIENLIREYSLPKNNRDSSTNN